MGKLFNCDSYLQKYFETSKHSNEAEATLETAREELQAKPVDPARKEKVSGADRRLRRVQN